MKSLQTIEKLFIEDLNLFTNEDILFNNQKAHFEKKFIETFQIENNSEIENTISDFVFLFEVVEVFQKEINNSEQINIENFIDFCDNRIIDAEKVVDTLKSSTIDFKSNLSKKETEKTSLSSQNFYYYDIIEEINKLNEKIRYNESDLLTIISFINKLNQLKSNIEKYKIDNKFFYNFNYNTNINVIKNISILTLNKDLRISKWFNLNNKVKEKFIILTEIEFKKINRKVFLNQFSIHLKDNKNIIPQNWQKIIQSCFHKNVPNINGFYNSENFINSENNQNLKLSPIDYSYIIALKNNCNNNFIISAENTILLPLSGGILAEISFKNHDKNIGFFIHRKFDYNKNEFLSYKNLSLYELNGYTNGNVEIKAPKGYIFSNDNFLIEINFHAAPILFENSNIHRIANTFLSDANKIDDEEEENNY
jgi:hypothetical protein